MADGQTQTFDPDAFHQQYAQQAGGAFDPDTFHAKYAGTAASSGADDSWDAPPESLGHKIVSGAEDVGIGALKGVGHSLTGLAPLINKIPYIGESLAPSEGIKAAELYTKPHGIAQKTGFAGEQAGEFLLPSGLEEKGAAALAEHAPALGKLATPLARTITGGLTSGAVNKMQGGSFSGGAAMGAGTGAVSEAAKSLAPSIAESALGITKNMRGFGKTPGKAALEETGNAIRPGTIAAKGKDRLNQLLSEMETKASASTVPASTKPALDIIDREQVKAINKNSKSVYDMLHDLRQQLTTEFSTGNAIPQQVPASKILALKRGIGDLDKTWNPEQARGMKGIVRQVYGALDSELDRTVPGSKGLNQRISSLIPVAQRAESTERGAEFGQRVAHRMAAHTGALAASGMGAGLGYERGGGPGAVIGGTLGLVTPEILASPTSQMMAARALRSPTLPHIGRGLASQLLDRKSLADEPDDEEQ